MSQKISPDKKYWDRMFATPGILGLITTINGQGQINAAAFATCVRAVHNPLQISFVTDNKGSHTYENIQENREFVVNLPSYDRDTLEKVCIVGLPFARGVNELEKANLTAIPSLSVKPPRVKECKRHFECEMIWVKEWRDRVVIMGNVVSASIDSDCVGEEGFVLWDKLNPALYCGAPYVNQPPHQNRFVAAYENMPIEMRGDHPEVQAFNKLIEKLDI